MIRRCLSVVVRTSLVLSLLLVSSCNSGAGDEASGDPTLTSLALSAGTLVPAFDPATTSYTVAVGFLATQVTVSALPAEASATVTVNDAALSMPVAVPEGPSPLTVRVRTADGATQTYTLSVVRATAATFAQQAYLKASNTGVDDLFGISVALAGDTLAVGAYFEDSAATGVNSDQFNNAASAAGAVYVFTRTGPTWTQQAYLKASNTEAGDFFGVSVALAGDTLAVGAYLEDSAATGVNGDQTNNAASNAGAVYVSQ